MRKLFLGSILIAGWACAQAPADFENEVIPVLSRHCYSCHNEKLRTANLDLAQFRDAKAAASRPEVWDKVQDKLASRKMPPAGQPQPARTETAAVLDWIQKALDRRPNPGRVTARRLNRVEYDNTIRDLLDVPFRASADFPTDDSGYGFDNNGDVLSLSPLLMEKYMHAARRISRLAFGIYDDVPSQPTVLVRYMAKRSHDAAGTLTSSNILPYSMRGSLYTTHMFPVNAEYEFRFRVVNFREPDPGARRGRRMTPEDERQAYPPVKVVLTVDGGQVAEGLIEGITTFEYDRGELVGRVRLAAGPHRLRVSFPELANLASPLDNIRPDLRRRLFVDYLDIVGPFAATSEPPPSYRRIFSCTHARGEHDAVCARRAIEQFASRAWRRPVTKTEVDGLFRFVGMAEKAGDRVEDGVRLAVQAILVSPKFLFRIEPGPSTTIGDFELASRLSYFLWSSTPDEELLRAAAHGELRTSAGTSQQVRRMLLDAKSKALVENFAAQWLQLRLLDRTRPDPMRFPTVDDELVAATVRETELFLAAMIREDRPLPDLLDAPFTYLNGPLARHYGIQGVEGEAFRRVTLEGTRRGGLLTQASILALSSYPTRTSPVLRGKWVLENILGAPPPPPPPDVPDLEESKIGSTASLRAQLEQHRANPACAVCHTQMDAIGFGLEGFDAAGAIRTHDGKFPIDDSGTLPGGQTFRGPTELLQILKSQPEAFTRCLTEKMMTFALGRGLEAYDRPEIERIVSRVTANNYRFTTLIHEIANSSPFRTRRGDP